MEQITLVVCSEKDGRDGWDDLTPLGENRSFPSGIDIPTIDARHIPPAICRPNKKAALEFWPILLRYKSSICPSAQNHDNYSAPQQFSVWKNGDFQLVDAQ